MIKVLALAAGVFFSAGPARAAYDFCARYENNRSYSHAIEVVAKNLDYTKSELCGLSRLLDIHVTTTGVLDNTTQEIESHFWVTLHYGEYSCQYFVREADSLITKKNCYSTF